MLALFCTHAPQQHEADRIKTQNMIVLTVEFTRILFPGGGSQLTGPPISAYITLRRVKLP
jgi:hypothetical protein